ncbi:MAG: nodulation protein NfeD [Archaeoglobi archaeon]|nr:nodulation protein NfeD [Candidatus Mnemosynella bozhongmuii]
MVSVKRFLPLLIFLLLLSSQLSSDSPSRVYVLEIHGTVTHGTSEYVLRGISEANRNGAQAILILLDTPGGLLDATLEIVKAIENSSVPVITYVYPRGAIAASAGTFILLSGHIAAMSPGTSIGAATPVQISPEGMTAAERKVVNFYASYLRSLAEERGRNGEIAEKFVTEALSLGSREALEKNVIEFIADSPEELLEMLNGSAVKVGGKEVILRTSSASMIHLERNLSERILDLLSNPQISFIFLMIGIYSLIFGLASPGTYIPETIGAIFLLIALYSLGLFEVQLFALFLILLGILFFIAELMTPTFGALTVAGAICIFLGAILLPVEPFLPREWYSSFLALSVGITAATALFFIFGISAVLRVRKRRARVGGDELIGMEGVAITRIEGEGQVKVRGEIWKAFSEEVIEEGEKIVVVSREGLKLKVRKKGGEK